MIPASLFGRFMVSLFLIQNWFWSFHTRFFSFQFAFVQKSEVDKEVFGSKLLLQSSNAFCCGHSRILATEALTGIALEAVISIVTIAFAHRVGEDCFERGARLEICRDGGGGGYEDHDDGLTLGKLNDFSAPKLLVRNSFYFLIVEYH